MLRGIKRHHTARTYVQHTFIHVGFSRLGLAGKDDGGQTTPRYVEAGVGQAVQAGGGQVSGAEQGSDRGMYVPTYVCRPSTYDPPHLALFVVVVHLGFLSHPPVTMKYMVAEMS